jgi:hypothetical protein
MQGKFDPRRTYSEMRPEYLGDSYLDLVVNDDVKHHKPFADQFVLLGMGNHESTLERNTGTNLIERTIALLNSNGGKAVRGGYTGYIVFYFVVHQTHRQRIVLKYHHGKSTRAEVTRGVIDTNRMSVMFPDADIVVSGHDHNSWVVPIERERINQSGNVIQRLQHHVRTPGYKRVWGDDSNIGFDVEKGSPKPNGCVWIRFYYNKSRRQNREGQRRIDFDIMQDVE